MKNYSKCLGVDFKIGEKSSGFGRKALRIQFKNRIFYNFLLSIGLTNKKSLTLRKIEIPPKYFFDFLRGCFDGDGSSYSYWDPRWRSSFMYYIGFSSGSRKFLEWIQEELKKRIEVVGYITSTKRVNGCYQLKYAKREAMEIIKKMYYSSDVVCLSRKREKIETTLKIDKKQQFKYI
ncbi:MAG: LAGLIDADG family homing endonuclease [Parcubacteria group bacterium]